METSPYRLGLKTLPQFEYGPGYFNMRRRRLLQCDRRQYAKAHQECAAGAVVAIAILRTAAIFFQV
jgi:hypothetical protein